MQLLCCSAGQAVEGLAPEDGEECALFDEHEVLERMRAAVSCNPQQQAQQQQRRRLSAFAGLSADAVAHTSAPGQLIDVGASGSFVGGEGAELAAARGVATDPGLYDDSAYEEELGSNMMQQINREIDEVLDAIDAQQKQDAAAAVATVAQVQQAAVLDVLREAAAAAGADAEDEGLASDYQSDAHTSHTPYTDVWDGEEEGEELCGSGPKAAGVISLHVDWASSAV